MHRGMHVGQVSRNAVWRQRKNVIGRGNILLNRVNAAGKRITLVRLAAVAAPVTQEPPVGHVARMIIRNFASQIIELQR